MKARVGRPTSLYWGPGLGPCPPLDPAWAPSYIYSDRKCPRGFYTSDFLFIFRFFNCFLPIAFRVFSSHQACACTDAFFLCRHPDHPRLPRLPQRQRRVFTELGHYPSRQLLVKTKEASCAARNTICHERGSCDGLLAVFRVCVPFSFEFIQFS